MHVDELCDVHGDWASIDLVMRDWRRTHSPLAHWYNQLAGSDARHWADVREDFDEDSLAGNTNLTYGLPQASCAQNSKVKKRVATHPRKYRATILTNHMSHQVGLTSIILAGEL